MTRRSTDFSSSHASSSYFDLSSRRSINPVCRDVQATLSSFRFSGNSASTVESPTSGAPDSSSSLNQTATSDDDEYVEPSSMMDSSLRPSVQRTSSAPEPSSSKSTLFVEAAGPSTLRPSLARACSESRASGVLERRRRKVAASNANLLSNLVLDLADLPMTMGAGNLGLLRAARKAITEPCGFDWGRVTSSAPPSGTNSRFLNHKQQGSNGVASQSVNVASKSFVTASLPSSASVSAWTSPEAPRVSTGMSSSRSHTGPYWSVHMPASDECEWDWALAGNARATYETLRFCSRKETKEPIHDIWQQLPDWVSRRSSLGGRDADLSLRGPSLHNSFAYKPTKDQGPPAPAALAAALAQTSISQSPRSSISGRGRMVHVPFRVIEEVAPDEAAISPRASVANVREAALGL